MNFTAKKIAVTGGSGFIGSAICLECQARGQEVIIFDKAEPLYKLPDGVTWFQGDICNKKHVRKLIKEVKPDHIYMVAGILGTSELNRAPGIATLVNIHGVANFMDFAVTGELPSVFFAAKPNIWENMYTITKQSAERIIQLYMKEYGLMGTIHRWYNAYGPRQHTHPVRKAVPYFILMALNNLPVRIHGSGNQATDYIHVQDVAKIAVESMNNGKFTNSEIVDVGTGVELKVNDLAEIIIKLSESKSKIIHVPMREGEIPETKPVANAAKIKKIMGADFEFTNFEKGMLETIDYYRNLPGEQKDSALEFYMSTVK